MEYKFSDFEEEFKFKSSHPLNFDHLVSDGFEAKVYADFIKNEIHYFQGVEYFIMLFRQRTRLIKINTKPSENFKNLIFYLDNYYSEDEILFYLQQIQKWIAWNEKQQFSFLYQYGWYDIKEGKMISLYPIEDINNTFLKLNGLIEIVVADIKRKRKSSEHNIVGDINRDKENADQVENVSIQQEGEHQPIKGVLIQDKREKYKEIGKRLVFLINSPNTLITRNEYILLMDYIWEIIDVGHFRNRDRIIRFNNINKYDIVYTFKLINDVISGKQRHLELFKLLTFCVDGFEEDKKCFDVPSKRIKAELKKNSSIYKNFTSLPSKDYARLNPYYIKIN